MANNDVLRLAVLIDADNASAAVAKELLEEVAKYGSPTIKGLLTHAIKETLRDNGWAPLSAVGTFISKNNASFDPRNYGFTKLGELVRKQLYVEVKDVRDDASGLVHRHVRTRP